MQYKNVTSIEKRKKVNKKKVMPTDRTYFFGDVSGNKEHFCTPHYNFRALDPSKCVTIHKGIEI